MAKAKPHHYYVTDPLGVEHTRNSPRIYTHAVIARPSYDNALHSAQNNGTIMAATHKSNFHYYRRILGLEPRPANDHRNVRPSWMTEEAFARQQEGDKRHAEESLMGAETLDAYVAACVARRIADVEDAKVKGYYDRFDALGFCGRADLAAKLVASTNAYWTDFIILPVQERDAPAKPAKKSKAGA